MDKKLEALLTRMKDNRASDLHLTAGSPPHYRIDSELEPADNDVLGAEDVRKLIYSLITEQQRLRFEKELELDLAFSIDNVARFRANIFMQMGKPGCAIRIIPYEILSISDCGLPEDVVKSFCGAQKGLVLVTGATGSGKSTTLAAMVDEVNSRRRSHIITVEDPVEFVHRNKKALIDQRQISSDTRSFHSALKYALRQDPDVILIGELRDLESISQALIIADTSHLVLATLHTSDSVQAINRLVDVFPSHQQAQIRSQLSFVLLGIISQQLIPKKDASGRVLAAEVLVNTPAIRNLIRDSKEHQIYSVIQTSQEQGMCTMNQALADLYAGGVISYEEAVARSGNMEELINLIGGI
ncbi:MAG: PilT/PilU family type 4a pilus ATPase [Candidatus Omnitrophica bacterium]|nr:PilT/PilU family type 4a pilus ATPase [Candidatus Omnitrophota bacterium]